MGYYVILHICYLPLADDPRVDAIVDDIFSTDPGDRFSKYCGMVRCGGSQSPEESIAPEMEQLREVLGSSFDDISLTLYEPRDLSASDFSELLPPEP